MKSEYRERAEEIIREIWSNLNGRSGFDSWVSEIDPEILEEILADLTSDVEALLIARSL